MIIRDDRIWSRAFTPEMSTFFERYYASRGVQLLKQVNVAALEGRDVVSEGFSVWWLKNTQLIAAFVMNRPDEERQLAPEWIKAKQIISPDRLADKNGSIGEAARQ